jgi:hypothetical protein
MTASPGREVDANLLRGAAPECAQTFTGADNAGGQDLGNLVQALGRGHEVGVEGVEHSSDRLAGCRWLHDAKLHPRERLSSKTRWARSKWDRVHVHGRERTTHALIGSEPTLAEMVMFLRGLFPSPVYAMGVKRPTRARDPTEEGDPCRFGGSPIPFLPSRGISRNGPASLSFVRQSWLPAVVGQTRNSETELWANYWCATLTTASSGV